MNVIIDGVRYVPESKKSKKKTTKSALDLRLDTDVGKNITLREYLYTLLKTLWAKNEDFSGKRPFGNSNWQFVVYKELIKEGYISGKLDDEGYVADYDPDEANEFVQLLIAKIFKMV